MSHESIIFYINNLRYYNAAVGTTNILNFHVFQIMKIKILLKYVTKYVKNVTLESTTATILDWC